MILAGNSSNHGDLVNALQQEREKESRTASCCRGHCRIPTLNMAAVEPAAAPSLPVAVSSLLVSTLDCVNPCQLHPHNLEQWRTGIRLVGPLTSVYDQISITERRCHHWCHTAHRRRRQSAALLNRTCCDCEMQLKMETYKD